MRKAAHVLSVLLHPVWMPTYALAIALAIDPHLTFALTRQGQWLVVGMVFVMTAVFPVSSILMLWHSGLVGSLSLPRRKERLLPVALTLIYFGMAYYLLRRTPNSSSTLAMFTGIVAALAAGLVITGRWKVSLHMIGAGGLLGILLGLALLHGATTWFLPIVFVLVGALGSARLLVGGHSPAQVYAGTLVGLASTFVCVVWGLFY